MELMGGQGRLVVSDERTLAMVALMVESRLRNLNVSLNLIASPHAEVRSNDDSDVFSESETGTDALQGIQRAWMYTSMMDRERDRRPVRVAVIDSSFCEGLADECTVVGGYDFANFSDSPYGIADTFGIALPYHGTAMASVIGGHFSNGVGAAGVGGQVADLLLYNVGGIMYFHDAALATFQAVADGAEVINMSFGFPCGFAGINFCDPFIAALTCATIGPIIDAALLSAQPFIPFPLPPPGAICPTIAGFLASAVGPLSAGIALADSAGVSVVASAGNAFAGVPASPVSEYHIVPAMIEGVITVGVTDSSWTNTNFFGPRVDVWVNDSSAAYYPLGENCTGFDTVSVGQTSTGAAIVSGVVAMMRAVSPETNPAWIRSDLRQNTTNAPGGDPLVSRFLLAHLAVMHSGRHDFSFRSFAPSLGFDEWGATNRRAPTYWVREPGGWLPTLLNDSADDSSSPILISVPALLSEGSITFRDRSIHSFGPPGQELDSDWYGIYLGDSCESWDLTVTLEYPTAGGHVVPDFIGRLERSTSGPLTRATWTVSRVSADPAFLFQISGEDNYYRMTLSINESQSIPPDRFEPDNNEIDAPVLINEWTSSESLNGEFTLYSSVVRNASIHCSDDEDWYRVQLDPDIDSCSGWASDCGMEFSGGDFSYVQITGPVRGEIEVFHLDGTPYELDAPGRIDCPITNGMREFYVRVTSDYLSPGYDLLVHRTEPNPSAYTWFDQVAAPYLCCEYAELDTCLELPENFDESLIGFDALNEYAESGVFVFDGISRSSNNSQEATHYLFLYLAASIAVDFQFEFPEYPEPDYSGALVNPMNGGPMITGLTQSLESDSTWHLRTDTEIPAGHYVIWLRGLRYGQVFEVFNRNPPPLPRDYGLEPRVLPE
ncbi:MAG: S8/S53 family peptidase, partial [Planctomycetota bacterium]